MPRAGGQEEFTNKGAANWLRWNETPTKTTDRFTVEVDIKDGDWLFHGDGSPSLYFAKHEAMTVGDMVKVQIEPVNEGARSRRIRWRSISFPGKGTWHLYLTMGLMSGSNAGDETLARDHHFKTEFRIGD